MAQQGSFSSYEHKFANPWDCLDFCWSSISTVDCQLTTLRPEVAKHDYGSKGHEATIPVSCNADMEILLSPSLRLLVISWYRSLHVVARVRPKFSDTWMIRGWHFHPSR
jgi:hypothetical protein